MSTVTSSGSVPEVDLQVPDAGTKEYEHWQKTGELELPEEQGSEEQDSNSEVKTPSKEESATSSSEAEKPEAAAGPEPARPPQKKTAEARLKELLAERKEERRKWDEERQNLIRRISEPERKAEPAAAKPVEKKNEAKAEPQPEDKDESGQPKYKTWGEYQRAYNAWVFEEAERRANARVDERLTNAEKDRQKSESDLALKQSFTQRSNEARKKYSDYDQVALNPEVPIPHGSILEQFILESEQGAEIAYHMGQNPAEAERMTGWKYVGRDAQGQPQFQKVSQGLSDRALTRELTLLELSLMPDEEEAPKPKAPAKSVSKAPPPPHQVTGKSPSSRDEVEAAVDDEDQDAYMKAANARDLARRKKGR